MKNQTPYHQLDVWAKSVGITADDALKAAVDDFYARCLDDTRLCYFFEDADLDRLKEHQFNFMRYAFSAGYAGDYTGKSIFEGHEHLIRNQGLNATHFDYVAENLVATLNFSKSS